MLNMCEAFYKGDAPAKKRLVDDVRDCCLHNGFFQITGHNVSLELQHAVMDWNKKFFDLPLEQKMELSKGTTNPPKLHKPRVLMSNQYIRRYIQHMEPRLRAPQIPNPRKRHPPRVERGFLHRRRNLQIPPLLHQQEAQLRTQHVAFLKHAA